METSTLAKPVRRRAEDMYALIEAWRRSGQTQKAFCTGAGVSLPVFWYWLKRYREEEEQQAGPEFVPLRLKQDAEAPAAIEIVFPGGITVRFKDGASAAYLRQLLFNP
jgi:hypothetical protein